MTPERAAHWIARRFLRGRGLEIGALACPMPLAPGVRVLHLDRLDPALQERHYPEVTGQGIQKPDLVGEGDDLSFLKEASFDFLVASHLIEHVANPLRALIEWHRVLKPDGTLLLVVPDKRHTFDRDRERTSLGHLVWHLHEERRIIETAHFAEWSQDVEKLRGDAAAARARELEAAGYAVHAHVWVNEDIEEMLLFLARSGLARFEIAQRYTWPEITYQLVKAGPSPLARAARKARVLTERAVLMLREQGAGAATRKIWEFARRKWSGGGKEARSSASGARESEPGGAVGETFAPVGLRAGARTRIEILDLPFLSVLTPVKDPVPEHLREAIESVRDQSHGRWEQVLVDDGSRDAGVRALLAHARRDSRCTVLENTGRRGISGATQRALEAARGSHVVLLDHDDRLHPGALDAVARAFWRGASYVYSDHDLIDPAGQHVSPALKPGWSPELLLSTMYPGHLQGFERRRLLSIGGFRSEFDGSQDYDVALRYTEGLSAIEHLPHILHHWRQSPGSVAADPGAKAWARESALAALREALARRGRNARVEAGRMLFTYRVAAKLDRLPTVTAIVDATGSTAEDVARTLRLLAASDPAPSEVLLAGESGEPPSWDRGKLGCVPSFADFEEAARRARGDVLLFMRGKTDLADPRWILPLLEQVVRPEIGLVAPRLTYPRGQVEMSAMVADEHGRTRRCRWGLRAQPVTLSLYAHCVREVTTLPSVGMMMRREAWDAVGGHADAGPLAGDWLDVDLSFRVRWSGLIALLEPHSVLHAVEPDPLPESLRLAQERELAARWGVELTSDPHLPPALRRSWLAEGPPPGPTPPAGDPRAPGWPADESSAAPARAGYGSAPAPPPGTPSERSSA